MYQCTMISRITARKKATLTMIFLNGQDQKLDCREFLSDDNSNHYRSTCITLEDWWPDVKDRKVENWGIEIKGHGDPVIWIHLVEEEKNEK